MGAVIKEMAVGIASSVVVAAALVVALGVVCFAISGALGFGYAIGFVAGVLFCTHPTLLDKFDE